VKCRKEAAVSTGLQVRGRVKIKPSLRGNGGGARKSLGSGEPDPVPLWLGSAGVLRNVARNSKATSRLGKKNREKGILVTGKRGDDREQTSGSRSLTIEVEIGGTFSTGGRKAYRKQARPEKETD